MISIHHSPKPDKSLLLKLLITTQTDERMPQKSGPLPKAQVELFRQWIDEGALPETLDCDPDLACGAALTCCDGLLYPTTCCETNCDEPIGECGDILAGDLNLDGILNILDIVLMMNIVLGDGYDEIADMNGDEIINILDIVTLVNIIIS